MLLIMNSWKRCPEINKVRKIGRFSSNFCFKGSKIIANITDFETRKALKMYKTIKA